MDEVDYIASLLLALFSLIPGLPRCEEIPPALPAIELSTATGFSS